MTRPIACRITRGFSLFEMLLVLPLFGAMLAGGFWLLRAQMSTHDRLARQANRHVVMRAILTNMRSDFARAESLAFSVPEAPAAVTVEDASPGEVAEGGSRVFPSPGRGLLATLTLSVHDGEIQYQLYEDPPLVPRPVDLPIDPEAMSRRLVRVGPDEQRAEWGLRGQMLDFEPGRGKPLRTVRVRFQSRNKSEGARQSLRRYETTLLVGGVL